MLPRVDVRWGKVFNRKTRRRDTCVRKASVAILEQLETRRLLAAATWIASDSGFWEDAANWNIDRAPAFGDSVNIDVPGVTVTVRTNVGRVDSLTSSSDLKVTTGGTISSTAGMQISGKVTLEAGTLETGLSGPAVFGGEFVFSGGTLFSTGGLTTNGQVTLSNNETFASSSRWTAAGDVKQIGTGNLSLYNSSFYINGTYDIQGDAQINGADGSFGRIFLTGTMKKTGGAGTFVIDGAGKISLNETLRPQILAQSFTKIKFPISSVSYQFGHSPVKTSVAGPVM